MCASRRPAPGRILIVDDAPAMLALMHRVLTSNGYQVDTAPTLARARTMGPGGYGAVVIDARLGPDRGTDLIGEMIARDPTAGGRCLLITGGSPGPLPEGVSFLAKPFRAGELLEAVARLADPGVPPAGPGPAGSPPEPDPGGAGATGPAGGPPAAALLEITRRLRECERAALLDYLHASPVQEIAAATLALHLVRGSAPPALAGRFTAVEERLDEAARSLRRLTGGREPVPGGRHLLADSLRERTAWLLTAPLTVRLAGPPAGLAARQVPGLVDLVELALFAVTGGDTPAVATAAVGVGDGQVTIDLTISPPASDLLPGTQEAARSSLAGLAAALGGTARADFSAQRRRAVITAPWGRWPPTARAH